MKNILRVKRKVNKEADLYLLLFLLDQNQTRIVIVNEVVDAITGKEAVIEKETEKDTGITKTLSFIWY